MNFLVTQGRKHDVPGLSDLFHLSVIERIQTSFWFLAFRMLEKKNALYLSVDVFSTKVLTGDTIS